MDGKDRIYFAPRAAEEGRARAIAASDPTSPRPIASCSAPISSAPASATGRPAPRTRSASDSAFDPRKFLQA